MKKSTKTKYYWLCTWDNGKGAFNPDRECCRMKSDAKFETPLAAAIAGAEHDEEHGWCGWGYAPMGWENHSTSVYKGNPSKGKHTYIGKCNEILDKEDIKNG